ncbi:lipopolysaccharide-binding protein-like [Xenopus tropicalis]|uniref:Bactericidal permeability-increasing protein n=1 Tax=Xenopus tropicalis TaxID=8364 RepID=A0A803J315_XENTR|nr:lipopolysaccharide-binding protein-like [Xenopus tropicalis]
MPLQLNSTSWILLCLLLQCLADNPGVKIQITQNGLYYGAEYLISQISSVSLSDITGSVTIASQSMDYSLTQVKMVSFQYSNSSANFIPEKGFQISIYGGNSTVNGTWQLDSSIMQDSGLSILTLKGISATVTLGMRQSNKNMVSIFLISCQSEINGIDFRVEGGVDYVYDAVKGPMENIIRSKVNEMLCSALRLQISDWDQSLSAFLSNMSLSSGLDLSLTKDPIFSKQYAEMDVKGGSDTNISMAGGHPSAPMTFSKLPDSMVQVCISEFSLNVAIRASFAANVFTNLFSGFTSFRNIRTSDLSDFLPEISQHFPEPSPVQIRIYQSTAPTLYVKPSNVTVAFVGVLQTYAMPSNTTRRLLFTATTAFSISSNISVSNKSQANGMNITGSIILSSFQLQINRNESSINIPEDVSNEKGIQDIIKVTFTTFLNEKIGKAGIYIPLDFLRNLSIYMKDRFILLAGDLQMSSDFLSS